MDSKSTPKLIRKVCGMLEEANILSVAQLQPDMIGFIFYKPSPRCVPDGFTLPEIDNGIHKVGVFVDAPYEEIIFQVDKLRLDYVQLHGNESPETCKQLQEQGIKVIKVFAVGISLPDYWVTVPYLLYCDYFLLDTHSAKKGGSGLKFDWSLLEAYEFKKPILLSGGIGPEDALTIKNLPEGTIAGVDLNSKFEIRPGRKDVESINQFFEKIK